MKRRFRHQIIKQTVADGATESIAIDTDIAYDKVVEVSVYTDATYATPVNLTFTKDVKVGNEIVFEAGDSGFDTALLSRAYVGNLEFIKINPVEAKGKSFQTSLTNNSGASVDATIVLRLENDEETED